LSVEVQQKLNRTARDDRQLAHFGHHAAAISLLLVHLKRGFQPSNKNGMTPRTGLSAA